MSEKERNVRRVLVMIEYAESDPDTGEVFDVTALATELAMKGDHHHAMIELQITARQDYTNSKGGEVRLKSG